MALWDYDKDFVSANIELYAYFLRGRRVNQRVTAGKVPKKGPRPGLR